MKTNNKDKKADFFILVPDVLNDIIKYIEDVEQVIDGEWGSCRDLNELIRDRKMPDLYDKLIAFRDGM